MLEALKSFFRAEPEPDYNALLKQGAVIVDVRSKAEFAGGHIAGSVNIPLDQLQQGLSRLRNKNQPIIMCCASGMRSGAAKRNLEAIGYAQVYNGGGWHQLQQKLN